MFKDKNCIICGEIFTPRSNTQTDESKDRFAATMQVRYGVDYPMQSSEIKEKHQKSCLENRREIG